MPAGPEGTPLSKLREIITETTGLNRFKVVFNGTSFRLALNTIEADVELPLLATGGVMLDDRLSLSQYGVRDGSILAIIGSAGGDGPERVERERASGSGSKGRRRGQDAGEATQHRAAESIKTKVREVKEQLGARVDAFVHQVCC